MYMTYFLFRQIMAGSGYETTEPSDWTRNVKNDTLKMGNVFHLLVAWERFPCEKYLFYTSIQFYKNYVCLEIKKEEN